MPLKNQIFSDTNNWNNQVSKVRQNREYLLSNDVATELNTYLNFGIFKSFNDVYAKEYDKNGVQKDGKGPGTPGVRSLFNPAGAVLVGTENGTVFNKDIKTNASQIRISNNVPLMDSPSNRERIKIDSDCSIKKLVEASKNKMLGREIYSYADFMFCKHLGKISNNHLITLRRFPIPIGDFISTLGEGLTKISAAGNNEVPQPIGCMVNWMGTPGNEMVNLLKYSFKMPFRELDAKWEDVLGGSADAQHGILNGVAAAFDPAYRKQFMAGQGGSDISNFVNKFYNVGDFAGSYNAREEQNWRDANKVYGPIDAVKKTYARSDQGIDFDQTFNITFDYELRSYNGINPRQAMLDLLSNILNVTYTTGDFWGGGYMGVGQHQNSIFSKMSIFKANNGFSGFVDAFAQDYSTIASSFRNSLENVSITKVIKSALNQLGGMIMAGALNKLGRPVKSFANSLLSEAPVGFWHLTIGNPFHPILSVGNLVLTNTTVEHYGPLGMDDFPTGLRVTCELTRGKPRDIREIEKMYMHGSDKIYFSMGPKVLDMYENSESYKNKISVRNSNSDIEIPTNTNIINNSTRSNQTLSSQDLKNRMRNASAIFGRDDITSVIVTAKEQDYGSQPKVTNQNKK